MGKGPLDSTSASIAVLIDSIYLIELYWLETPGLNHGAQ